MQSSKSDISRLSFRTECFLCPDNTLMLMKHKNSLILTCCSAGLALIAIVLMSCFGGSSHNEPLPSCSSIHTEKEDCPILDISLRYDLNKIYNNANRIGKNIQSDLIELEVAHPGFYANQLSGTFVDFYPILGSADHLPNYSSDQLPSVEFAFSATDCSEVVQLCTDRESVLNDHLSGQI